MTGQKGVPEDLRTLKGLTGNSPKDTESESGDEDEYLLILIRNGKVVARLPLQTTRGVRTMAAWWESYQLEDTE